MRTMQASVLRTLVLLLLVAGCARFNPRPLWRTVSRRVHQCSLRAAAFSFGLCVLVSDWTTCVT